MPAVVNITVVPPDDLPEKEWQVTIPSDGQILKLKGVISEDYGVPVVCQKITLLRSQDGLKDSSKVSALPGGEDGQPTHVFLLPARGKDDAFLQAVLEADELGAVSRNMTKTTVNDLLRAQQRSRRTSLASTPARIWSDIQKQRSYTKRAAPKVRTGSSVASNADGSPVIEMEIITPVTDRLWFNVLTSVICILNVIVIGFEADYSCWGEPECKVAEKTSWYALEMIFCLIFIAETALRIFSVGPIPHFLGDPLHHHWGFHGPNCADFLLVTLRAISTLILANVGVNDKVLKIISCLRVMQFGRVAKHLRLVRTLRELWLIIAGFSAMFTTVVWVMLLLILLFWVFGIVMTISVGKSSAHFDYSRSAWSKNDYFGTVPKSVYSLFQIMTFGKWSSSLIRPVFDEYPWIFLIIVPFMCLASLGLMNIIVGVIVESTIAASTNNEEKQAKEVQKMHAKVMESLKTVFEEADTDGGGMLDREELRVACKKPHVRERLKLLDIPSKDLDNLFDTLDENKLGEIKTEKFFRGCSRLRGPALSCDMHRMSVDLNRYINWTDDLVGMSRSTNDTLERLLTDIEGIDRDIVVGAADVADPVLQARRKRTMKRAQTARRLERHHAIPEDERPHTSDGLSRPHTSESHQKTASFMGQTLRSSFQTLNLKDAPNYEPPSMPLTL